MNRLIIALAIALFAVSILCLVEIYRIRCQFTIRAEVDQLRADVNHLIEKDVRRNKKGRGEYYELVALKRENDRLRDALKKKRGDECP